MAAAGVATLAQTKVALESMATLATDMTTAEIANKDGGIAILVT